MKYAGFTSIDNERCTGILSADGGIEFIEGDIFGEHQLNDEKCRIEGVLIGRVAKNILPRDRFTGKYCGL